MDALPADGAAEADVQRWLREYAQQASSPPTGEMDVHDPNRAAA